MFWSELDAVKVNLILAALVGLSFGVLLILALDTYFFISRFRKLSGEKRRLKYSLSQKQEQLQRHEKVLFTAQQELHELRQEQLSWTAGANQETLAQLQREVADLRARLAALELENERLQRRLQNALNENLQLRENSEQISAKWELAENKHEDVQKVLEQREKSLQQVMGILTTTKQIAQKWIAKYRDLEREKRELDTRLAVMQERVDHLQVEIGRPLGDTVAEQALHEQLVAAKAELTAAQQRMSTLNVESAALQGEMAENIEHQLEEIRGIGPTYARRLRKNGIRTLVDLIRTAPEDLAEIVQLRGPKTQPESWIEEAKTLHSADVGDRETIPQPAPPPQDDPGRPPPRWQPASG